MLSFSIYLVLHQGKEEGQDRRCKCTETRLCNTWVLVAVVDRADKILIESATREISQQKGYQIPSTHR